MDSLTSTIAAICSIPDAHAGYSQPSLGLSALELAQASGYLRVQEKLGRSHLTAYLMAHPERVEHWQLWSDNKRVSEGWYFDADARSIGWYGRGGRDRVQQFASAAEACAEFILRELESILSPHAA